MVDSQNPEHLAVAAINRCYKQSATSDVSKGIWDSKKHVQPNKKELVASASIKLVPWRCI
jgi:hypothetical protein